MILTAWYVRGEGGATLKLPVDFLFDSIPWAMTSSRDISVPGIA